jgi:hypothetical protein
LFGSDDEYGGWLRFAVGLPWVRWLGSLAATTWYGAGLRSAVGFGFSGG